MSKAKINQTTLELQQGDITKQVVDAIVNAANSSLLGGGGVDGAIHRAAGPDLLAECRKLDGCPTGDARITKGYRLPAKHVIHAVGPIYGKPDAPKNLASAYRRSLEVAVENKLKTVAFPAISTGVYGYPMVEAAQISLSAVADFLVEDDSLDLVVFVLFGDWAFEIFQHALADLGKNRTDIHLLV